MKLQELVRKKSVEEILKDSEQQEESLKRALGAWDLILLGIGAVIGAGIFVITGTAAAGSERLVGAGPSIVISFLITGLACSFSALCYAELASIIPIAGSAYTYTYATLGEFMAWIIGWDLILEYVVAAPAVAIGWSGYFISFLTTLGKKFAGASFQIPSYIVTDIMTAIGVVHSPHRYIDKIAVKFPELGAQLSHIVADPTIADKPSQMAALMASNPAYINPAACDGLALKFYNLLNTVIAAPHIGNIPICFNLPAMLILAGLTVILMIGISESSKANKIIVALKFLILAIFVGVGVQHVNPANWVPFMPNGIGGVIAGSAMIFFAYIGFDSISTVAEETKDPAKDMPIGIIGALAVCTILYIIVAGVMTGICPWNQLGTAEPMATALHYVNEHIIASYIVSVGAVISIIAVLIVMLMAQPRVLMCMARDGFLPDWFAKIHPKYKTPLNSTLLNGIIVTIMAGTVNINDIAEICNIGTLFAFVLVSAAVIILRVKSPELHRPFRAPLVPWIPIAGIIIYVILMLGLSGITWVRFGIWLLIGVFIYFLYSHKNTKYTNSIDPTNKEATN